MYWLAQQRTVAWLVAGLIPAIFYTSAIARPELPSTQPATLDSSRQLSMGDGGNSALWPEDDAIQGNQPGSNSPSASAPPAPQPINNPLPPALWSALSVFGLLGLYFALRRLQAQL
jgi:hypothetical protein